MIALLQRVTSAHVAVGAEIVGRIEKGILVFVGIERDDDQVRAVRLTDRLLTYRVFSDTNDRMNLSLLDIGGGILLVPQFTLAADTRTGTRPSFTPAAAPETGRRLFQFLLDQVRQRHANVQAGQFGADMQVSLTNDGPVTFWLKT